MWCPTGISSGPSFVVPVGDVVRKHGLTHHVYADDKDIYIAFKPTLEDVNRAVQITENCLTDLRTWFAQNFLQLNDDKTIFMLIGSKFKLLPKIPYIQVGEIEITPFATATNLGVTFDEHNYDQSPSPVYALPGCYLGTVLVQVMYCLGVM